MESPAPKSSGHEMIHLLDEKLEEYAEACSTPTDELLRECARFTLKNVAMPQMLVGPLEGQLLSWLVRLIQASYVVEIGTFTGYSALWMVSALPRDGTLVTCEVNPEHARIARGFFQRSPHASRIQLLEGPALRSLESLQGGIDFAFIDADKENYRNYVDVLKAKMSPGGVLAVDNVLWSGRVLEPRDQQDDLTRAIVDFNTSIRRDSSLRKLMLPLRDGLTLLQLKD
ncbi:MAG: O-methyltransferase [Acidobacteriota bacterium]